MHTNFTYQIHPPFKLLGGKRLVDFEFTPQRFSIKVEGQLCAVHQLELGVLKAVCKHISLQGPHIHLNLIIERLRKLVASKWLTELSEYRLNKLPNTSLRDVRQAVQRDLDLFKASHFPWYEDRLICQRAFKNSLETLDEMRKQSGEAFSEAHCALLLIGEGISQEDAPLTIRGRTALHYAAITAEMENVKSVLRQFAQAKFLQALKMCDEQNFTPLDYIRALGRLPQFYKIFSPEMALKIKDIAAQRLAMWSSQSFQPLVAKLVCKRDWFGKTGLHWAVLYNNIQTIQDILDTSEGQKCKDMVDIFGNRPLELALQQSFSQAARALGAQGLLPRTPLPHNIAHGVLLEQFRRYFEVQNRDITVLNQSGICNAASFLFTIQPSEYFYAQLEALATWNGKRDTLTAHLKQQFERTISAMHWFQESLDSCEKDEQSLAWLKRKLAVVNPDLELIELVENSNLKCDVATLSTKLAAFQEYHRLNLFLGGCGHAVAIKVRHRQFHYYDINFRHRAQPQTSALEIAKLIAATKYRQLKCPAEPMQLNISAYWIKNK